MLATKLAKNIQTLNNQLSKKVLVQQIEERR